jgi:galactonate dehydratase
LPGAAGLRSAITTALLDITGQHARVPVYQLLGGPTRHKVRVLAGLEGSADEELARAVARAWEQGFRAFAVPAPRSYYPNQGQPFVQSVLARLERTRKAAPGDSDFVLDCGGKLSTGDAGALCRALERLHLLWLDQPCRVVNFPALKKIAGECVVPLGFGWETGDEATLQDLLREQAVDVWRPDLSAHGIWQTRKMAALAEIYYVAVAPHHDGGPVGTAAALHLAASLPNFFIQQIPCPSSEEDARFRAGLVRFSAESTEAGFAALPTGPGLGVEPDPQTLERWAEETL